ncbi:uncharacterized protein CEXT_593611 [Caerostris extrusa]|uniref:Uncharacterized protein n=1 Tax=Caerostris extrusa TaxID=172846 RepID=A0AAV4PZL6_CAEEX|nr:uncharacterized protein CEXT_593611 [Caerostris extrusa]
MRWHDHQLPFPGSSEHPWAAIYFNQAGPKKEKGINITNSRTFRPAIHQSGLWHRFDTVRPQRKWPLSLQNPGLEQKSRTLKRASEKKKDQEKKKKKVFFLLIE